MKRKIEDINNENDGNSNGSKCLRLCSEGYYDRTWYPQAASSSNNRIPNDAIQPVVKYYLKAFCDVDVDNKNGRKINEQNKNDEDWDTPLIEVVRNRLNEDDGNVDVKQKTVDEASLFVLVEAYPEFIFSSTSSGSSSNSGSSNNNHNKRKSDSDNSDKNNSNSDKIDKNKSTNEDNDHAKDNVKGMIFDINAQNIIQDTALHIAASSEGCYDAAKYLIDCGGANANIRNQYGQTPLHRASHSMTAKLLLARGVEVNATDLHGYTALNQASETGALHVVKCLIRYGVDVDIHYSNMCGYTPLHSACSYNYDDEFPERYEYSSKEFVSIVEFLLENGASMNASNSNGSTALHLACEYGNTEMVKCLIGHGSRMDVADSFGKTALHRACQCEDENPDIVKCLLEYDVDNAYVNLADAVKGFTPLHEACRNGNISIAKILLDGGADIHRRDRLGNTPLHYASETDAGITTLLIDKGADPDPVNNFGLTPLLWFVLQWRHDPYLSEIVNELELLIDKGAKITFFLKRVENDENGRFELCNEDEEGAVTAKIQLCTTQNLHNLYVFVPEGHGDNGRRMEMKWIYPGHFEMGEDFL